MMCGHAKELIASSWADELDPASEAKLKQHLSACPECAFEMTQLGSLWERLGDIPAPEPSQALNMRWESTLESLISARRGTSWRFSLSALWPQRPVWQVSIAAACLAVGLAIGSLAHRAPTDRGEIAQLREEVSSTKQLVALSLLQQQSATERLRGVDYTAKMPAMEPDVVSALVQAVKNDPNVNVKLAAIDALTKVSNNAGVRESLTGSLGRQESPMVQAALIDYAVDARDRKAVGALKEFTARPDLNPLVKQRADMAVQQLTEYK
jgi:HEAT repeats/Putative zinc-finger